MFKVGNAPCSWGVEFADDPRNPHWKTVLKECRAAGYSGIELGPVGYLPEDSILLKEALDAFDLSIIGATFFKPFHDPNAWDDLKETALRTCHSVKAHGGQELALIDSIAKARALTAGRPDDAIQMSADEWRGFVGRFCEIAKIAHEEYGLNVSIHSHAGGFCDFHAELVRFLDETDDKIIKICLDTGHALYAGFEPVSFIEKYYERIAYIHLKDIDPLVKKHVVSNQITFYDACAQGIFCNLGQGGVDFPRLKEVLTKNNFEGWCTVEQDCDPQGKTSPFEDAKSNRDYLTSINFI